MRDLVNRWMRRLGAGWFWAGVLLILPNCSFSHGLVGDPNNLDQGTYPYNSAVFCDIEKALGRRCATTGDLAVGIRLSEAAIALNEGRTSNVGLDDSADALTRCGGKPEAILYEGPFPQGFPVCLNCGVLGTTYTDVNAACAARCLDFYGTLEGDDQIFVPEKPPNPSVLSFCNAHARASTNMPISTCFPGACNNDGVLLTTGWADPRRFPEPVVWQDLIGVVSGGAVGNDLSRPGATTGEWDAGAVSTQWLTRGDGWVEFSARPGYSHAVGLTAIPASCAAPCPDTDPNWTTIGFGMILRRDGYFFVIASGTVITGPGLDGSFGQYTEIDRFRVRLRDNGDGSASVRYARLIGPCLPETACNESQFYEHVGSAPYPLRVDTSLHHEGATLLDVRLVRIQ